MYKKPFFIFSVFLFLLSLQTFVRIAESAPALETTKGEVHNLIDSSRLSEAAAMEDKLIADNPQDPCLPKVVFDIASYHARLLCYDYGRAKALYNRLIQLYPSGDYAAQARLEISKIDIFAKIEAGNLESAGSDIEQIIVGNSDNPYFSKALYDIAVRYTKRYYFDRADVLYKRLINLCLSDSFTDKAKFEQIKNDVFSKFMTGDTTVVNDLLKNAADNYPNHEHLPGVLYFAADKYEENYGYAKAKAIYNQILQINPDSSCGRKSAIDLIKLDIYEKISDGNFTSAQDLTEKLIVEHPEHPYLPEVLYTIADYYTKCSNYERARNLYSRLMTLYPEDGYSSRARVELALLDIRSKMAIGTFDPAQGEIEQLISKREKDFLLARRCYELGDYCLHGHNYEAAIPVLEMVWRQFPEFHYYCGRAKICCDTAKVCEEIKAGNLTNAQATIAKLKQNYAGYYYLPGQLYYIARAYSGYSYQDQSRALCDEVINMGEGKYATHSNMYKYCLYIHSRLEANDLAGAKQLFSQFRTKYANSLYLEEGILDLAGEFYRKGLRTEGDSSRDYLREVIAICQTEKPTEADFKIQSFTMLGQSYFRLGDFAKSAYYCQKLVDEYPDSRFVWHAQFMVGYAYENMQQTGAMSEQEAAGRIRTAYQNLLEKYPNCKSAKMAQKWLENHN